MKRWISMLAAVCLCLAVNCCGAEEEYDIGSEQVEASVAEVTFDLGGDEEEAPESAPAEEIIEDQVTPPASDDPADYVIPYPDVYDIRDWAAPSARVYPGKLVWPLKGETPLSHLTSHVGWRDAGRIHRHQGGEWPSWFHHGIDVGGVGTDQVVVAAQDGVAYAGTQKGNGNYVVIDHGNGWYTKYQHLSRFAGEITKGCRALEVKAGDPIGYVGSSGGDYPVHFHFEIAWSPDGPGADDDAYHAETHNLRIRAYSFPQESVIKLRWAARWEICSAEYQSFVARAEDLLPEADDDSQDDN